MPSEHEIDDTPGPWEVRTSDFHGGRLISRHRSLRAAMRAEYAARETAGLSRAAQSSACRCPGPRVVPVNSVDADYLERIYSDVDYLQGIYSDVDYRDFTTHGLDRQPSRDDIVSFAIRRAAEKLLDKKEGK